MTREVTTGTCVFEGTYVPQAEAVSARGSYRCTDLSAGTFVAPLLRTTHEGIYAGQIIKTASSGATSTETHAGMGLADVSVLDFTGKTIRISGQRDECSNKDFRTNFVIQVSATTLTFSGSDQVITDSNSADPNFCRSGPSMYEVHSIAALRAEEPADPVLQCLPKCSMASLNTTWTGIDSDKRYYRGTMQHTPGSSTLTYTKKVLQDPRQPGRTDFSLYSEVWVIE